MQIYRKVERVTEQACIYDVKILWSRYMVCVASLERYFTSVGLVFPAERLTLCQKPQKCHGKLFTLIFQDCLVVWTVGINMSC